jgi:hypothetical protein
MHTGLIEGTLSDIWRMLLNEFKGIILPSSGAYRRGLTYHKVSGEKNGH